MVKKKLEGFFKHRKALFFSMIVCFSSSLFLSFLIHFLLPIQKESILINQNKELLIAARLIDYNGKHLEGEHKNKKATNQEIIDLIQTRIRPMGVNEKGEIQSLEEMDNSQKIVYLLFEKKKNAMRLEGFILPIDGKGLWGPIKGYLCLERDANTVRGMNWYSHQETPGLGAFISDPQWQIKMIGKKIFSLEEGDHSLGLYIVQGGVEKKLGKSLKKFSSIDGVSGATLTGIGVTEAYETTLEKYRLFLTRQRERG